MTGPARAIRAGSLAVMLAVGCSAPESKPVELSKEEQAILNVGLAYRDASYALKRGPANEREIKPYLKKYGDPDQLLVSPADGQPYQLVWGLTPRRPTKSAVEHPFLAYEKTGKDGKRFAVDVMLKVRHLTAKQFAALQGSK